MKNILQTITLYIILLLTITQLKILSKNINYCESNKFSYKIG